jgi:hypothetical protein
MHLSARKNLMKASALVFWISAASLFVSLLFYGFTDGSQYLAFPLIHHLKMLPPFADLRWVTSMSECNVDLDLLAGGKLWGCDPYGRGGNLPYPHMSVLLARFLMVKGAHTSILGFLFGLSVSIISVLMIFRKLGYCTFSFLSATVFISSLPMQLALERSNIDTVVYLLIASLSVSLSLSTASFRSYIFNTCSFMLSFLLVAIKAYPAAGLLAWLICLRGRMLGSMRFRALAVMLGTFAGLASITGWLFNSSNAIPKPSIGIISHGWLLYLGKTDYISAASRVMDFLPSQISFGWIDLFFRTIPVLSFVFGLLVAKNRDAAKVFNYYCGPFDPNLSSRFTWYFTTLSLTAWLGCYLLTSNYDYRMILAFPGFVYVLYLSFYSARKKSTDVLPVILSSMIFIVLVSPLGAVMVFSERFHLVTMLSKLGSLVSDLGFLPFIAGFLVMTIFWPAPPSIINART